MRVMTGLCLGLALAACVTTSTQKPKFGSVQDAASYNVQLGIAYMEQGNLGAAKEKLERAAKENGNDPIVHSALALLYERLSNPAEADRQFRIALRLAPQNPEIENNYAVYLCRTNRVDEGVRRLLAVAKNPLYRTPEAAYTNAAVCLRSVHRDEEADRSLITALQIRPGFAEAAYQLADLDLQHGRLGAARTRVDGFVGRYSATPELLLLGVRVARAQGDRLAAEQYARRLRVDFPDSEQTRSLADAGANTG
jgi:type IV pilus assembly protein PilF